MTDTLHVLRFAGMFVSLCVDRVVIDVVGENNCENPRM